MISNMSQKGIYNLREEYKFVNKVDIFEESVKKDLFEESFT